MSDDDLSGLISRLLAAVDKFGGLMEAASEASAGVVLLHKKVSDHPDAANLTDMQHAVLEAIGDKSRLYNAAFAEIHGRPQ